MNKREQSKSLVPYFNEKNENLGETCVTLRETCEFYSWTEETIKKRRDGWVTLLSGEEKEREKSSELLSATISRQKRFSAFDHLFRQMWRRQIRLVLVCGILFLPSILTARVPKASKKQLSHIKQLLNDEIER